MPWNQNVISGYIYEICYDLFASGAYMITNGWLLLVFVSICLHHQAFYKMFHRKIRELNEPDRCENDEQFLCNLIQFQNTARG